MSRAPRVSLRYAVLVLGIGSALLFLNLYAATAAALSAGPGEASADDELAVRGQQLFEKRCAGCHTLDQNHSGPRLRGVFGRKSGQVSDFPYSEQLKSAGIVWDEKSLEKWLTDPDTVVHGNNMDFNLPKQEERKAIIRYLKQLTVE